MPPPPPSSFDVDLLPTALYLIQRGYWCALYELYVDAQRTGALDADDAARSTLAKFFADRKRFPKSVLLAVKRTFDSGVSAARVIDAESRAALAEYELRVARDDSRSGDGRSRTATSSAGRALDVDDAFRPLRATANSDVDRSQPSSSSGADVDDALDEACYEFLSLRGYRATALAMRDESRACAEMENKRASARGDLGALRRMYDRARMTEHTARALEGERARSDGAESELVRARARADELESDVASARETAAIAAAEAESLSERLRGMTAASLAWEKRANAATNEVMRLRSRVNVNGESIVDGDGGDGEDWLANLEAPRTTKEEDETMEVLLTLIDAVLAKLPLSARAEVLPAISRVCVRAADDVKRSRRAANMFFDVYKKPNEEQRFTVANAIARVGEIVGVDAFDAMFTRGCLSAETSAATRGDERRALALEIVATIGASPWYTTESFVTDSFKRGAGDPNEDVRAQCSRALARCIAARSPTDVQFARVAEDILLALACDASEDVAEATRAALAPAMATWYLASPSSTTRFTDVVVPRLLAVVVDALSSGWSGAGAARSFVGWPTPEEADRQRWRATSTMKVFEAMMGAVRRAIEASAPPEIRDVDLALGAADVPGTWPLAKWCVGDASAFMVRILSSATPDVVGQESVRESLCSAIASWCKTIGPYAARSALIDDLNEACVVSRDQRGAVLPLLLAGVVPNTPNGENVLEDYIKRLIEVEAPKPTSTGGASTTSLEIIDDAARYLAASDRHTACLLRTLMRCARADNDVSVRALTARLLAATSEVLPLANVLEDVFPTLGALKSDASKEVRQDTALALASVACSHFESVEATTAALRQLEVLASDAEVDVRRAVVVALSRGASVPGTSFAVSAANAISAIARIASQNATSFVQKDDRTIAIALFAAARELLSADGSLFPALAPALVALLGAEDGALLGGALDHAQRAQAHTMLRDGGWHLPASSAAFASAAPQPPIRETLDRRADVPPGVFARWRKPNVPHLPRDRA